MTSADASAGGDGSAAAELVFDEVTKRYPGRTEPAVRSLSLAVPAGGDRERAGAGHRGELGGGQRQRGGGAGGRAGAPPLMLMDEPFGAIDPITRDRLQNEFLRLHREIRKTVIFVTHDIDEAIKMGDRIAILRQGGVLAQYATPDEILASPVDDFVASFVGADRGLKRLALTRVSDLALEPLPPVAADGHPTVPETTSLRDALSLMLTHGGRPVRVIDRDGRATGAVSAGMVRDAASNVGGRRPPIGSVRTLSP